jgi:DNA-binding NarL/FixJ family response regulator
MKQNEDGNCKGSPTVLIAEEHDVLRTSLCDFVSTYFPDVEIIKARNSGNVIFRALAFRPDVIIMDMGLSSINILETSRHIKGVLPQIQIIVMTTHENLEYHDNATAAGIDVCMEKHMVAIQLFAVLRGMLSK